jgi:organic radical activating enzyme
MSYAVKEIFYTLQGEGALTGRPAVFCRFAGCNLWSGARRAGPGRCNFCDFDFIGTDGANGGRYADAEMLADAIRRVVAGRRQTSLSCAPAASPCCSSIRR